MTTMSPPTQAVWEQGTGFVELAEPEVEARARTSLVDTANDWLCAWCRNRVASEKDRCNINGQSEHGFTNPAGVGFNILLFSSTLGCESAGEPTLEHTWFPGHAWSFCFCDRCRVHLGWFYTGPTDFVGLIRDRIVRAATVAN